MGSAQSVQTDPVQKKADDNYGEIARLFSPDMNAVRSQTPVFGQIGLPTTMLGRFGLVILVAGCVFAFFVGYVVKQTNETERVVAQTGRSSLPAEAKEVSADQPGIIRLGADSVVPASSAPLRVTKVDQSRVEPSPPETASLHQATPQPPSDIHAPVALGVGEVADLMGKARALNLAGDTVSARGLYQKAAESGYAEAALALGQTFDNPAGDMSDSDRANAHYWYSKARELGSLEAPTRLKILSSRE